MIIDTSALMAILQQEPEAERFTRAIALAEPRLLSAANLLETGMVVRARFGPEGERDLDFLLLKLNIEVVPVTPHQVEIARKAFPRYGKGFHPAGLNVGDCFAYGLAKETGQELLFKGQDFTRTDLQAAAY